MKSGKRHDIWVAGVDTNEDAAGRYFADYFETVPNGDEPGYVEAIADIVRRQNINLVLPWSDEEALSLSMNRDRIKAEGAILACTSTPILKVMNDKAATFQHLEDGGLRVPAWALTKNEDELRAATEEFQKSHGEFVVKPVVARGNRGTFVIREDADDMRHFLGSRELHMTQHEFSKNYFKEAMKNLPVMVMERLFAPAYDIDVLARAGVLLRAMPRERMNPAGVPFTGGILRPRPELMDLAEQVTAVFELDWLYDYDLMTTRDGDPVVIEVNPRPSGSIAAAILAGIPFYDDIVSLAKNEMLPAIQMPEEVAVVPYTECKIVPVR
jgi:carbamoylphosphate synthase large subunit